MLSSCCLDLLTNFHSWVIFYIGGRRGLPRFCLSSEFPFTCNTSAGLHHPRCLHTRWQGELQHFLCPVASLLKEPLNNPYKTRKARAGSEEFGLWCSTTGYLNQRTYGISLSDTNSLRSLQLHTQNPVCGHRNCTISCLPWGIWPHLSEAVCLSIGSVSQALRSRGLWNSGNVRNHVCMYMHMSIAV